MEKSKSYQSRKKTGNKVFSLRPADTGNKERKQLYDSTWYKYRLIFLKVNKFCYVCGEKSTIVDHVIAHKNDEALFKDTKNHIPLCTKCHNTATGSFDHFPIPKTQEKLQWMYDLRKAKNITILVKPLPRYGSP